MSTEAPETVDTVIVPPRRGRLRRLAGAVVADWSPWRDHRDVRLLTLGGAISRLGSTVTIVAVPFQIWSLTRSTLAVGLVGACELVPMLTVALYGGVLADKYDRRRLAMWANVGMAAVSGVLALNATLGRPNLAVIYAMVTATACLYSISWPAIDAIYPRIVPADQLAAVSALNGLTSSLGMVLGPALAGVILAAGGAALAYALDGLTFAVAIVCIAAIRPVPPSADGETIGGRSVLDGLRFLRGRPVLQATYLIDSVAMVFGMSAALFPAVAADRFADSPRALGLMYAAPAVGAVVVSAASGWMGHVRRQGVGFVLGAVTWGLAIVAFGLVDSLALTLGALAVAGGGDMVSGVFRMVIWNTTIPDSHRGRLAGVTLANVASGPALGDFEAGVVAALTSVRTAVVSGGAICVAGVLACAALLPQVLRYDSRSPTP